MEKQRIDTALMLESAGQIRRANTDIEQACDSLRKKKNEIFLTWNSKASDAAWREIDDLFRLGSDNRSEALLQYAELLEKQVSVNYDTAEKENTRLSDQFIK